jgi:hypothetical protein
MNVDIPHFVSQHVILCLIIVFVIYKILKGEMKIGKNFLVMLLGIWIAVSLAHTLFMTGCGSYKNTTDFVNQHPSTTLAEKMNYLGKAGADAFFNVAKDDFKAIYAAFAATMGGVDSNLAASNKCLQVTASRYELQPLTAKCSTMTGLALETCQHDALCDFTKQGLTPTNGTTACQAADACESHGKFNPTGDNWFQRFIHAWIG